MGESNVFGISVRAIACIIIVVSFCGLAIHLKELAGLKELALIACGYLFGKTQTNGGANATNNSSPSVPANIADPSKSGTT